ncbi:MAG TPA: TIGR01212 family radical SAM protein [Bacteroidales bacterium]|nr:TIGR01212 family radical SAM protein [Bacteroidales bacterium]
MHQFPWHHQRRFNSYAEYFKRHFGHRVQKLTIDAGFTCPNRDGSIATGGCTYCNNEAFNPSYCTPHKSITRQLSEGIEFHQVRYRNAQKYLAYFQAFSNTYAPLEILKQYYEEALAFPDVIGLVIGTRPDCVDAEKLDYIARLAQRYYIIIEYGIESIYNTTLKKINRGHSFEQAVKAIEETKKRNIKTGAHFIIGLPGETEQMLFEAIPVISSLPLDSIKFHQLQIFKGTVMASEYAANPKAFNLYSLEQYLELIVRVVEHLNPAIVIERIAGEAPPWHLASTSWGLLRINDIVRLFEQKLEEKDTWQGKFYL